MCTVIGNHNHTHYVQWNVWLHAFVVKYGFPVSTHSLSIVAHNLFHESLCTATYYKLANESWAYFLYGCFNSTWTDNRYMHLWSNAAFTHWLYFNMDKYSPIHPTI